MPSHINLTGKRFGKLVVLNEFRDEKWFCNCLCDCGKTKLAVSKSLRNGKTKSCGCGYLFNKRRYTHGLSGTKEHQSWENMKSRCYNKNNRKYKDYGGRGIKVCDRWKNSVENFYADMGDRPSPSHSIERKNNNGNYSPENCCWGTRTEQNRNKRNNRWFEYNGEKSIVTDLSRKLNIPLTTLRRWYDKNTFDKMFAKKYSNFTQA